MIMLCLSIYELETYTAEMNSKVAVINMRGPTPRKSDGGISTDLCISSVGCNNVLFEVIILCN